MNIEKRSSGSWRATIMHDGQRYRCNFDHRPTQKEVLQELSRQICDKNTSKTNLTFEKAAQKYIDMKSNVLSPSTSRNYKLYVSRFPQWFREYSIDKMSQIEINKVVNEFSVDKSPKTVRNYHGFITAVLSTFRPELNIHTTLPQKRKIEPYIPSSDEIKAVLEKLRGTEFEIAFLLACMGLRRSEITAADIADVDFDNYTIRINKAKIPSDNGYIVNNSTKTTESERIIPITKEIADLIKEKGYIYHGHPNNLTKVIAKTVDDLGIQHFSMHKLRHYFASKMLTITDSKTVQALGGWKTDSVMKTVYAHSLKEEQDKAKRKAIDLFNDSLFH